MQVHLQENIGCVENCDDTDDGDDDDNETQEKDSYET